MTKPPGVGRWRQVDDLFDEALNLDPEGWEPFLAERCGEDEDLRRAVAELLAADVEARQFLGDSATEIAAEALVEALRYGHSAALVDRTGERVGPWHLVRRLGRGGMAGVYLAERADEQFEQTVAIKFIRRGLDSEDFVRRFLAERQILSGLHHPNIASLIGGGATDDGLPYLVLEYVDGVAITEYCDAHRCTVPERLRLFLEAARAVQYAHANLVIHRDIKPNNILVTNEGHVMLLDFGIAKLLDPNADPSMAELTRVGFRPLTPEYASPEQVRGDSITTASDVYQLGVLLYRLLTGERPYDVDESRATLKEAITETQPTAPSVAALRLAEDAAESWGTTPARLERRLRGDLDLIVLKSLRKDPNRRYGSVVEMAEDVRRHLEGRPIVARPESRLYRGRKFLQRHPWVTPVAAGATIMLGMYIGTLIRHGQQLQSERNAARVEAERADALQQFLVGLFESADPFGTLPESSRDIRVSDVMEQGIRRARSEFSGQPELRATMLGTIGDVFVSLGDPARGVQLREEAYETARTTFGEDSQEAISAMRALVEAALQLDRRKGPWSDSAPKIAIRALNEARASLGPLHPEALRAEVALGRALHYGRSGFPAAEPILRHAVAGMRNSDEIGAGELGGALLELARVIGVSPHGDRAEAEQLAREAIDLLASELGPDHARVRAAQVWMASIMQDLGAAVRVSERAGARLDSLLGPEHELSMRAARSLGIQLLRATRYSEAAAVFRDVLGRHEQRSGPAGFWYAKDLGFFANASRLAGRHEDAIRTYDELIRRHGAAAPVHRVARARSLVGLGRPDSALAEIRRIRADSDEFSPVVEAAAGCVAGLAYGELDQHGRAARELSEAARLLGEASYDVPFDHPCHGIRLSADESD